jgi:hypothetical protein
MPFFSAIGNSSLLRFLMGGMFLAEFAILFQLNSVGSIFFVFICPVITVFTFGTG